MIEGTIVEAMVIIDEPGDRTRYEHLVGGSHESGDYILVASLNGLYSGYSLRRDAAKDFANRYPEVVNGDRDQYQDSVIKSGAMDDPYVGYVMSHCGLRGKDCNPWTALSIIRAAHKFIMDHSF